MKVMLTQTVPHLGLPGDVCEVKDGYARNFLIPHGLAMLTSDPKAKSMLAKLTSARTEAVAAQSAVKQDVAKWADKKVIITVKANPDGTLFGGVTAKDVAKELKVDAKQIQFETMKTAGDFEAILDLGFGVTVQIPVMIVAEEKSKARR